MARSTKFKLLFFIVFYTNFLRAQVPVASFTIDKNIGCAPLVVGFTNTSSGAVSYSWNFGNSNTSTIANPTSAFLSAGVYNVKLVVTSAGGQRDSSTATITVVNNPIASFSSNTLSGCEDVNVISFTNNSNNSTTYNWDFGDGNTSTATNPTHTYLTPGTYSIKLIASNQYGCQDIQIKNNYIVIYPKPVANFSVNMTSSCNVSTVFSFTSQGVGLSTYQWNFGDGSSSSLSAPNHQYANSGAYTVKLITTNANGCKDTVIKYNYINIGSSLVPSFTSNDSVGCAPLPINFTSTVTNATSWNWNFGDGNTSQSQNPSHTYTLPGNYSITLSVTTQSGCNGSVTIPQYIKIDSLPIVDFTAIQDTGCAPFLVDFINNSTNATSYNWSFGNGGMSTLTNPSPIYNKDGSYDVTLTAYSQYGCTATKKITNFITSLSPNAKFIGSPLAGCPGTLVQFTHLGSAVGITNWLWHFGDGTISSLQNPSHTYNSIGNFVVWLIITNSFGCKDTVYKPHYINITSGIVPYTLPDTIPVCQGAPVGFSDPTLGSDTWLWNFGNGSTSVIQNPSYTYFTPGIYTVTLNTSMPGGCSQSFNPFAIVHVIPYDPKPIDINYTNSCKPYTVSFSTATPDITNYLWNFGDGDTSTLANPTHIYQSPGTYGITLNITIGAGCQTVIDTALTVGHLNPMAVNSNNLCKNELCQFTLSNAAAFSSWTWFFGDTNTSNSTSPTHTYSTKGSYIPSLITLDTVGCKDTFLLAAIIVNDPLPSFSVNQTPCINIPTQFQNTSTNANSYLWDFGDGTTTTDANPLHTYTTAGVFTVTLSATTDSCTRTITLTNHITVFDPICNFTYVTNGKCIPLTATFTENSPTAISWFWSFGDGTSSSAQNPVHTYSIAPTDSVKLTITDIHGCNKTNSQQAINYYSASGAVDNSIGCFPQVSQFNDLSTSATSWLWNFGDGDTSTFKNPSHTYSSVDVYTITLIETFPGGCVDTVVYPNMVTIEKPIANFYSPTIAGCSPTQINFTNQSAGAISYLWNFGDGGTSTTTDPSHIYYIPGDYDVTIIATSVNGCVDTSFKQNYIHIPGTYSHFNISAISGCESLSATFTDSSINATSWLWNFGDGFIDSIQNPLHVYQDTGSYIVTLITSDSLGCSSSYTFPLPVNIYPNPIANASVIDTIGCSSFTTTFLNGSLNADTYLWVFGDNDSSILMNPTHTYLAGGIYQPSIIAITQFGCRDTFQLPVNINVYQTPTASFVPSNNIGCAPSIIQFTNQSTNLNNPNYTWNFGDGSNSITNNPNHLFQNDSNYTISLHVANTYGCFSDTSISILINPSPIANATSDAITGCSPTLISFTNLSNGAISFVWNFGDGDTSTLFSPTHTYLWGATFNPYLVATNSFGCTDTFYLPAIIINQSPIADFIASTQKSCVGNPIQFTNLTPLVDNPIFSWNFGFTTSTIQNPIITFNAPGIYDVTLQITNSFGCISSYTEPAFIEIFDTLPPPADSILSVTVLSDTEVQITWANSNENDLKSYKLYRYNVANSSFELILSDINPAVASIKTTTSFTDANLNTLKNSYTYKLQTVDICDYALSLPQLLAHTTINITAQQAGQNVRVNWSPYLGCSVNNYEIWRAEVSNGIFQKIATIPGNRTTYLDTSLVCPFDNSYRVIALDLCGSSYTSNSDTSVARPINILENQKVEIVRSTVINNENVLTEWLPPLLHPERVVEYSILRSTDKINYTKIGSVPVGITTFTDTNVNVQKQEYYYQIDVVNDCELNGEISNKSSSILLQGKQNDLKTDLNWTPYKEWQPGVENYTLERQKPDGTWEIIKVVDGNITNLQIDE